MRPLTIRTSAPYYVGPRPRRTPGVTLRSDVEAGPAGTPGRIVETHLDPDQAARLLVRLAGAAVYDTDAFRAALRSYAGLEPTRDYDYGDGELAGDGSPLRAGDPRHCAHCGRPAYYDRTDDRYHHAVSAHTGCFLIPGEDRPDDTDHPHVTPNVYFLVMHDATEDRPAEYVRIVTPTTDTEEAPC